MKHKGFDYVDNIARLSNALLTLKNEYGDVANAFMQETQKYEFMQQAITKLGAPESAKLLRRDITFRGQYDISAFDVEVTPVAVQRREIPAADIAIDPLRATERLASANGATVSYPFTNRAAPVKRAANGDEDSEGKGSGGAATQNKAVGHGTIGNRRFELSGGIVYSSLRRTEFQPVLGFARDEQGNLVDAEGKPTDKRELSSIVGVSEDTNRRLSPMVMLHTRLSNFRNNNIFFSLGVTGKRDSSGIDMELLIGPSVNFFNNNLFFTIGGYAGRQQRLAGDLFLNARLPEGTDKVPIRKEYEWKPGFSFTYRFPLKSKTEESK